MTNTGTVSRARRRRGHAVMLASDWSSLIWPLIGQDKSGDLTTSLRLVKNYHMTWIMVSDWSIKISHVTQILASIWSRLITWHEYLASDWSMLTIIRSHWSGNGLGFIDTDPTYTLEQCAELHLVECGEVSKASLWLVNTGLWLVHTYNTNFSLVRGLS